MIKFRREGTKVFADIESGLTVARSIYMFHWEAGREDLAELLVNHLKTLYEGHIDAARYRGWVKGHEDGWDEHIGAVRARTRKQNAREKAKSSKG